MILRFQESTAVVTGAARGIGAALALDLAKRGCNLALADVDRYALSQTALAARSHQVQVSEHYLDVANAKAAYSFTEDVLRLHARVNLLFNNAGVGLIGTFEQISLDDFEWLLGINLLGVVRLSKAFLPHLKATPAAQIVNISSLFGLIAPAGQTAYCASKFAVRGFSEALGHELMGSSVGVTCVHPGGVRTAIADRARSAESVDARHLAFIREQFVQMAHTAPEEAARSILHAVERRKRKVLIGTDAVALDGLQRLMPVLYYPLLRLLRGKRTELGTTSDRVDSIERR
ncbi:MAG: SDR family NAD(P)-dependent oxidoreductase [Burkholderiaceae bacterium]|jgi:short-subunit dehydrogenase